MPLIRETPRAGTQTKSASAPKRSDRASFCVLLRWLERLDQLAGTDCAAGAHATAPLVWHHAEPITQYIPFLCGCREHDQIVVMLVRLERHAGNVWRFLFLRFLFLDQLGMQVRSSNGAARRCRRTRHHRGAHRAQHRRSAPCRRADRTSPAPCQSRHRSGRRAPGPVSPQRPPCADGFHPRPHQGIAAAMACSQLAIDLARDDGTDKPISFRRVKAGELRQCQELAAASRWTKERAHRTAVAANESSEAQPEALPGALTPRFFQRKKKFRQFRGNPRGGPPRSRAKSCRVLIPPRGVATSQVRRAQIRDRSAMPFVTFTM
jgi:hypothetical protein